MGNDHRLVDRLKRSRMLFVFDERMQHQNPSTANLCNAEPGSMREHERCLPATG